MDFESNALQPQDSGIPPRIRCHHANQSVQVVPLIIATGADKLIYQF